MAASSWFIYSDFKRAALAAEIDLDANQFYLQLHTSAQVSNYTLASNGQLTWELGAVSGYTTGGKALTTSWGTGASAKEMRFDATDLVFSATAAFSNVQYATIRNSANRLVAWSKLSSAKFDVSAGNTLTIQFSANGVFELN